MLFRHGYEGKAHEQLLPSWSMTSPAICERNHTDYVQTFGTSGYFELHSPIRLKSVNPPLGAWCHLRILHTTLSWLLHYNVYYLMFIVINIFKKYSEQTYDKVDNNYFQFRTNLYSIQMKVSPTTGNEGPEREQTYSSTVSLTSVLKRGWVVNATPQPLYPQERDTVPSVQEAGWAPGPVWRGKENLAPTGIRSPDCPARSK